MKSIILGSSLFLSLKFVCATTSLYTADGLSSSTDTCEESYSCIRVERIQGKQCSTSDNSESSEPQVLSCLCKLSDDYYWNYLYNCSKCNSRDDIGTTLDEIKSYYCNDSSSYGDYTSLTESSETITNTIGSTTIAEVHTPQVLSGRSASSSFALLDVSGLTSTSNSLISKPGTKTENHLTGSGVASPSTSKASSSTVSSNANTASSVSHLTSSNAGTLISCNHLSLLGYALLSLF